MIVRIIQNIMDIGIAVALLVALAVALVWYVDQRASLDAWKANRAEIFQRH